MNNNYSLSNQPMIRDNRKTFHIVNFLAQEGKKNQVIGVLKIYIIAFDLTHLLKRKKKPACIMYLGNSF